jgi:hypothetical protein
LIEHFVGSELLAGLCVEAAALAAPPKVDRSTGISSALTRSRGIL